MKKAIFIGVLLFFVLSVALITTIAIVSPLKTYSVTENDLQESISLGGEWFLNQRNEDSFIEYEYDVDKESYTNGNNYLRKMASLWTICKLKNYTNDDRYASMCNEGLDYFSGFFEEHGSEGFIYIPTDGEGKLGNSAFIILALLESDYPNKDELITKIADGILYQQQDSGMYNTYFFSDKDGGQDYYPGEANLALMELYRYTNNDKYKDAVAKSFDYYSEYWADNGRPLAFIPWQTEAFFLLYNEEEFEDYKDFIFLMSDYLVSHQQTPEKYNEEQYIGGYKFPRTGISTAVYLEGINDAYLLAKNTGDEERERSYKRSTELASFFTMSLQYRDDNNFGFNPILDVALGGFRRSPTEATLRVDNNQHAVMGLIKTYDNKLYK